MTQDQDNTFNRSSTELSNSVYQHVLEGIIAKRQVERVTCVAIDGVDGSGKTRFADTLADHLRHEGWPVIRASIDDFHNTRSKRYRQGRLSPQGFFQDSYNYPAFVSALLQPLGKGGNGMYRTKFHDLVSDMLVEAPPQQADPNAILIVDGIFLHRHELADYWNYSIFLDVDFKTTFQRMAARDGSSPDPLDALNKRYYNGQLLYFEACNPVQRASAVIDNHNFHHPRIVR